MFNKEFILLRFFEQEKHIEDFRSGSIRMRSAKYYKELEKHIAKLYDNRYDSIENAAFVYNPNSDGTIQFTEPLKMDDDEYHKMWVNPDCLCSPVIINNDTLDEMTKLFCMYSMFKSDIVDGKLSSCLSTMEDSLGDYYCLIINNNEFFSRIINGISIHNTQKITRNGQLGFVKYVNENSFNGSYGAFCKPSGLVWQREFRIKVETLNNDPFWLKVDSLKDITVWGNVKDLINGKINENGVLIANNIHC